jgi:hypothetical protein
MKYSIFALIRQVIKNKKYCLGTRLVTASADGTGRVHNVHSGELIA